MHKFRAESVTVLRFARTPDAQGHIVPPEAHCETNVVVPVIFEGAKGPITIGKALVLPRKAPKKDALMVNLTVESTMRNRDKALTLIEQLYPSVIMKILDAHHESILRFSIEFITLTARGNCDPRILPLGDMVYPVKEELDS